MGGRVVSIVDVHNEWDPLEEVVVGSVRGARVPVPGIDLQAIEYPEVESTVEIPSGSYPAQVLEETEEELDRFSEEMTRLGIKVRRPPPRDLAAVTATPDWTTNGFYDYCPRDILLSVGNTMIETPMVLRSRFLESFVYKDLLLECLASGSRWISAPKPRLGDDMYAPLAPPGERLRNLEPAFDAANVLRLGRDLLYLLSDSGNEMGMRWLQSALGGEYTVHPCREIYASTHVDSTIVPLRPGLVLLNPERVNERNIPDLFRSWDKIYCPELVDTGYLGDFPKASYWIGMNLLVLNPQLVVVDDRQQALIRALEARGMEVLPLRLTHARTLGGGFHCVTLDVRRRGKLESHGT
jgi:scyllo-inosamine-4-phosphate amidinotransferase 1